MQETEKHIFKDKSKHYRKKLEYVAGGPVRIV